MSRLQQSLNQILQCDKNRFAELFYPAFFRECPEVVPFFESTNYAHQGTMMTISLQIAVSYALQGYPAAASYLKLLGHRHYLRKIPVDHYPGFCRSMLATLKEFHGENWNAELEEEWGSALDRCIPLMLEGYTPGPMTY